MEYDYLVENAERDRFILVPKDDGENSLTQLSHSEEIKSIITELNLEDGFLSQYLGQLAASGSVSKDLLIEESATINEELDKIHVHLERLRKYEDEEDYENFKGPNSEVEIAWGVLKYPFGVKVLDADGYTTYLGPFDIARPITPKGTFVQPWRINGADGVSKAVKNVEGLDESEVTCYVQQGVITYDDKGLPTDVDNINHLTVGVIDKYAEFKPVATLLDFYKHEDDHLDDLLDDPETES